MPGNGKQSKSQYILNRLRLSVAQNALSMNFQPLICGNTGELRGVEALIRWYDGDTYVPPLSYILPAERSGYIVELGYWILNYALRTYSEENWSAFGIKLFVNVSGRQLEEEGLVSRLLLLTAMYGVSPASVVIELTETSPVSSGVEIKRTLSMFKEAGFLLALDDFGTGYSGVQRLNWMPIDIIKVDKSFVSKVGDGGKYDRLVRGIMEMARKRNLRVVAEGIETVEQQQWFFNESRDILHQGYLYAPPLEPSKVREFFLASKR